MKKKREFTYRIISSLVLIPILFFFIIKGKILFNFFLITCFFISLKEWYNLSKNKITLISGILFLTLSFFTVYQLRNNNIDNSLINFIFILIICISTDIGGYAFGNIFKGPKLTKISPNKTYSGVIGGYLISFLVIIIIHEINAFLNIISLSLNIKFFFLTFVLSTVSQLGDLCVSYFKRLSNLKDTGNIIPGHGGLLDRIDGMLFAFPIAYVINFSL